MSIRVLSKGLLTTVQDLGRFGFQAQGVPVSGAMDTDAACVGNLLVGNTVDKGVLELAFAGADLQFEQGGYCAVTGGDFSPAINGTAIDTHCAYPVKAGDRLTFGAVKTGNYCYVAVSGGIDVPPIMGSRSTYTRAALGGFCGRKLEKGDCIPVGSHPHKLLNLHLRKTVPPDFSCDVAQIRVILGPQDDCFTSDGLETFFREEYTVTTELDRMGVRLEGSAVAHKTDGNIISDGVAFGSVQLPTHGKPIIMLADRQTVGGYTKIAGVARCDLGRLVQLRPGERLRFVKISLQEAHSLSAEKMQQLEAFKLRLSAPPQPRRFLVTVGDKTMEVVLTE